MGHLLNPKGISIDPGKTAAILGMSTPKDVPQLWSFLGMVNRLTKLVPNIANKTQPLRDLLRSDSSWYWDKMQEKAFHAVKANLCKTPVLMYYDQKASLTVSTDASSYGISAVLLQETQDRNRLPVVCASRSLMDTKQRYAQVEKEDLTVTSACEHSRMYLTGIPFHVETDHKPLVPMFSMKRLDELPHRLQRTRKRTLGTTSQFCMSREKTFTQQMFCIECPIT